MQLHRRNVPRAAAPRRQGRRGLQPCGGQDIAPSAGALPLVPGGGGAPCCAKYQFSEPGRSTGARLTNCPQGNCATTGI